MIGLAAALLLAAPTLSACPPELLPPGVHTRELQVDRVLRKYHLYVPATAMPKRGFPVVVALHAAASSAAGLSATTQLRSKADQAAFIVAEPEGYSGASSSRAWNAGTCCGNAAADNVDDVAFFTAMTRDIAAATCVDHDRVFVAGYSNGGMMAQRLACEAADAIAAVASVSGGMADRDPTHAAFQCQPSRRVPVLEVHGTADACHPLKGGTSAGLASASHRRSVEASVREWHTRNGCSDKTRIIRKMNGTECRRYDKCAADVELCLIDGGGHAWPGGSKYELQALCGGALTEGFNATDWVWAFFSEHPRR